MERSDSDRTIDSDELNEILDKGKRKQPRKHPVTTYHTGKDHTISSDSESEEQAASTKHARRKEKSSTSTSTGQNTNQIKLRFSKQLSSDPEAQDLCPPCQYGYWCYRKSVEHRKEFYHPTEPGNIVHFQSKTKRLKTHLDGTKEVEASGSTGETRQRSFLLDNLHFGYHLSKVHDIPSRYNQELTANIKDILSPTHGKLVSSAQFNYMTDIPWLVQQYPKEFRSCPLLIVHGEERLAKKALEEAAARFPHVTLCQAKLEILYGTHHTKMMLLLYEKGLRVVIHTANLIESDWFQRTQGIWISPIFPLLDAGPSLILGNSETNFKADLLEYLQAYKCPELKEWCQHLCKHDLSAARVVLISSVPGRHLGTKLSAFGHLKLRKVLKAHGPSQKCDASWPIIAQFSSIGSLGPQPSQWLCGEWLGSFGTAVHQIVALSSLKLQLIYPSIENVRMSLEGYSAGASLPYSYRTALKQPYLNTFLHQWRSDGRGRSVASPHIKSYTRISSDNSCIAWFLSTSANLSKAAWGALEKNGSQLMIRSYELGVLFLPKFFGAQETFPVSTTFNSNPMKDHSFPIPYDLPLTPYRKSDKPWMWDVPHVQAPDRNGNMWCPPLPKK